MKVFKIFSPAIILGLAVGIVANAQAFGTVQTGGAFGVGSGTAQVATVGAGPAAAAPVGAATGFVPVGIGGLAAAGPLALGLGAIIAVGAVSGGGSTYGTN